MTVTTRSIDVSIDVSNDVPDDEIGQNVHHKINDFITQRHDQSLSPLRLIDSSIADFSTELANYLTVLNRGGSVAFSRGEDLTSIRLGKSLDCLFSTATPSVREGPPLTWTTMILFAGPHFEGSSQLKVGESSVELSEDDLKLLRSGRPWRFLSPWPDNDDCKKELDATEMALHELTDARKMMDEVLEKISLVEQHLQKHRGLISQLSEGQHHVRHRDGSLGFDGARSPGSNQGVVGVAASAEVGSSVCRNSPSTPTNIRYPGIILEGPNDPGEPGNEIARNDVQRDSQPRNDARQGSRLHISEFIQSLSEVLDDPKYGEAMHWLDDGRSFFIAIESKFPAQLLPRLSTKSYPSLIRRLYLHGFHKIQGAYRHDCFLRGQPSSIRSTREMSHSPSLPSPLRNSISQSGPRVKEFKRKRTRESD